LPLPDLTPQHRFIGLPPAGLVESVKELASAYRDQAMWLKYLGNGDAASTMGAIEHLAVHLGEKVEAAGRVLGEAIVEATTNARGWSPGVLEGEDDMTGIGSPANGC
jgi:hypothetical protein